MEIALWDILAQSLNVPVSALFGGSVSDSLPCYNTCISFGDCTDYELWRKDAAALAKSLIEDGYEMMKIWAFDSFSERSLGQHISSQEVTQACAPIQAIRDAHGDKMAIGIEGHSRWSLPAGQRIAAACEAFDVEFLEDLMPAHDVQSLAAVNASTTIPLVGSETVFTRYALRELITAQAVDIVMIDPMWCGGLGETRACAQLAATFGIPVILHNLGGPVAHAASCQIASTLPNLWAIETSRALTDFAYPDLVDYQATVSNGRLSIPSGVGIGAAIDESIWTDFKERIQVSAGQGSAVGRVAMGDHWERPSIR